MISSESIDESQYQLERYKMSIQETVALSQTSINRLLTSPVHWIPEVQGNNVQKS